MKQATNNDETTNQWMAFWHTVRHYRGWILLGTVMLSLAGFAIVLLMPDRYKATTTILVDPQKVSEKYVSPTVSSDPGQRLTTITQQVLSTTRLQQIIDDMHLYPELRGKLSREELIDLMRKDITITVKQGSSSGLSAFTIEYEGGQRQQVAQVANQLAASFIEWNVKSREQQTHDTTEFLDAQLKEAKQNLEQQEARLSAFKMRHLGEMPEQQTANMQALSQLQVQFQANADALNRLEVERTLLSRGLENGNSGAEKVVPVLTERAKLEGERRRLRTQLQDLQNRYTNAHPEVIDAASQLARVEARLKALPPDPPIAVETQDNTAVTVRLQILDRESKRLTEDQKKLTGQMASYRVKVDAVPVREQEMAELNRNYSVSKDHYQSLLDKTFSAGMAADLEKKQQAEHFTILDLAQVPEKPFKPKRSLLFLGAFLAALAMSLGLAYVKDTMNATVKFEREMKAMLPASVPLLAVVPQLRSAADRRSSIRFAVIAVVISLIGCALEAGLFLKLHSIL
ncbi:MAG TPA: GNVR domain-containing protein [Candidatus Dormibacteraeota bacterium]|jgi:succinoglycan biosynthesis transport protein ExoP|nr:GNVR domain-containing protein [Candidatus Dormibacteraeota bacterium]